MKRLALLIAVLPVLAFAEADRPRPLLGAGSAAYRTNDYETAATNFARAAAAATAEKLDPAIARFNEGNALLRAGRPAEAGMAYEQALRTSDLGLQSGAYYNRGNALMADAETKSKAGQFEPALRGIDEALDMYERSMLLNPHDRDPKLNHEIAMLRRQQVEEQKKQQEQQQQQDKQNQQNKDQQDQKNKDQQKQDKQDPSKQDQNQQKNDKGDQEKQGDQQKQDQAKQDDPMKQEPQKADPQDERDGQAGEPRKADKLTPEEAALLLDAMKQDEQAQRRQIGALLMRGKAGREQPVDKDW